MPIIRIIGVIVFLCTLFLVYSRGVLAPFTPTPDIAITASTGERVFLDRARDQIGVVISYDHSNGYYKNGGFPPSDTGVCSDVIWRAYRDMGYDLRASLQKDIEKNPLLYGSDLDSNINYRRVKRLKTYFDRKATSLTTELIPRDAENLKEWQPGDIVIFDKLSNGLWHIGIITDERDKNGVPYMLDNHGNGVEIAITPLRWPSKIIGHYRVF